jgi:gamma-glutamyltranspeptidase/glutathione hydrolase
LKALGGSVALALAVQLGACSTDRDNAPLGTTASSSLETKFERDSYGAKKLDSTPGGSSFAGAVVADEPTAALIARNVLEQGGNAADAATALYFALSVTYPAAASLGGGGVCLVRDVADGKVTSVSFLARTPQSGGAIAVPGNIRGMAYLQARFGKKDWASLVSPAERLAATGFQVSRATAAQYADSAEVISHSTELSRTFTLGEGRTFKEGDLVVQRPLAAILGLVRSHGVGGFYQGDAARLLVNRSSAMGGHLTEADLSSYRPEVGPAQALAAGELNVLLPAASSASGPFTAALWPKIQGVSAAALTDVANQTAAATGGEASIAPAADYGSTSFVTVDGDGGAVACALTMNGAFGAGRVADGAGVAFAASPGAGKGKASNYLAPVLVARAKAKDGLYAVAAGAGAPKGAAAIESMIAAALTGEAAAAQSALEAGPADARSPANAILCMQGLPRGTCTFHVNPKGSGVGFSAVDLSR